MEWRHYEVRQSGDCQASDGDVKRLVCYDSGIVETGRTRVFAGYFFRVRLAGDEQITAEDRGSMIAALWRLARNLSARGLRLQCAGMSAQWRESGLSQNTGWGYYGRKRGLKAADFAACAVGRSGNDVQFQGMNSSQGLAG